MPLLDKLLEKAAEAVLDEGRQEKWVASGFDKLVDEARGLVPKAEDGEELSNEVAAVQVTAGHALDRLVEHKAAVVKLGQHGLVSTIALLGQGDYNRASQEAALLQIRQSASWDDVGAAITTAAKTGNQKKRELDAARSEVLGVLKSIGVAGAKALLPFLLALL